MNTTPLVWEKLDQFFDCVSIDLEDEASAIQLDALNRSVVEINQIINQPRRRKKILQYLSEEEFDRLIESFKETLLEEIRRWKLRNNQ